MPGNLKFDLGRFYFQIHAPLRLGSRASSAMLGIVKEARRCDDPILPSSDASSNLCRGGDLGNARDLFQTRLRRCHDQPESHATVAWRTTHRLRKLTPRRTAAPQRHAYGEDFRGGQCREQARPPSSAEMEFSWPALHAFCSSWGSSGNGLPRRHVRPAHTRHLSRDVEEGTAPYPSVARRWPFGVDSCSCSMFNHAHFLILDGYLLAIELEYRVYFFAD